MGAEPLVVARGRARLDIKTYFGDGCRPAVEWMTVTELEGYSTNSERRVAPRDTGSSADWFASLSVLNADARALSLGADGSTASADGVRARCMALLERCLALAEDRRVPAPLAELFDLMSFELGDLRRNLRRLEPDAPSLAILEACDRVRGGIVRSTDIVALSHPNAGDAGHAAWRERIAEDVTAALLVRRLYTVFRRQMRMTQGGEDERELVACLRRVSTQIEVIRRQPEFRSFRLHDQQSFLALQRRLIGWIRQTAPRNLDDGHRMLSDVGAFAGLLRGINHRHLLVDFDRVRLEAFRGRLVGGREIAVGGWHELFFETRFVWGRDDAVDALLESTEAAPRASWLAAVEHALGSVQAQPFGCTFPPPADHPMMSRTAWSTFLPSPPPLPL